MEGKTLALFFTRGMSLKEWDSRGLLEREIALYNHLAKFFERIYFFTYGSEGDLNYQEYLAENIVIVSNPTRLFRSKNLYSFVLPLIHRKILREVYILKTNQMDGSWTAVIAKKLFKKPLVVRTGYTWFRFCEREEDKYLKKLAVRLIEKFAYSNADGVMVSSEGDLNYVNRYSKGGALSKVIPNYVDTNLFQPLSLEKKPRSLCFVGRLAKQKNLLALLEALKGSPYLLDIIGVGEEEENLKLFTKENNLNVNFLGIIPHRQLPEVLNQYEAFILPSLYEGMPKVLLEAMACGLSVIGTNVEGTREVIVDGENGLLCDVAPASIRRVIDKLFENEDSRYELGKKAREAITRKFALEKIVEKELNLYKELF